jgi:hypothetical protein
MLAEKKIDHSRMRLFLYGAWFKQIDIRIFIDLLREFSQNADGKSVLHMIGIIDQYAEAHPEILAQKDLIMSLLDRASILKDDMDSYYWNKVLQVFTDKYSDSISGFVDLLLDKMKESPVLESDAEAKIRLYLEKDPEGTWAKIKQRLNSVDRVSWQLVEIINGRQDFGKEKSLFSMIPEEKLWEWVDENPEKAPYLLARMIPIRELEPALHPAARKLLLKFPDKAEVRDGLFGNWYTEGFAGSASEHYKYKLKVLEEWEKDQEDTVSAWAKEEESRLREMIKREEIREAESGQI